MSGGLTRRQVLKSAAALAALSAAGVRPAHAAPAAAPLWGVNLAGAEFGDLPGRHGTEYLYPPRQNIDYYANLGFKLVRIPFKWERMQPELGEPLARAELALLTGAVEQARRRGLTVVLDPHNYARRRLSADGWRREYRLGTAELPAAAFADFWRRLALAFRPRAGVVFGLMNEPAGLEAPQWLGMANDAMAAIRSQSADNMVLVPGVAYSGAHSWLTSGNTAMARLRDPLNNFAIEVHQYLDADSSGTSPAAVSSSIGSERLEGFQNWARARGLRAFLGEYNAGPGAVASRALMDLCDELNAGADVWLGSAAWAGGPRWPEDNMFNLEPHNGQMRQQTEIILSRARPSAGRRYWASTEPAHYYDFARHLAPPGAEPGNGEPYLLPRLADAVAGGSGVTVLAEIRASAALHLQRGLLRCGETRLLYTGPGGTLATDLAAGLTTPPPPVSPAKQRWAVSLRPADNGLCIGMTGVRPVQGEAAMSLASFSGWGQRLIAGADAAGGLCRLMIFPAYMAPDEMAANLA